MPDSTARIKGFFTDLVDAVRYSQNYAQANAEADKELQNLHTQLSELNELEERIAKDIRGTGIDPEYAEELGESIGKFVSAAVQQTMEKLEGRLKLLEEESGSASHSERLKALRSLESYLASSPIHVLDEEVNADFAEGSYEASARYKCDGNVQYEFLLNTSNSLTFRRSIPLLAIAKGVRIPVRLSRTWLRREPTPDFEKLDQFFLQKAHATKTQLVALFQNADTNATLNFVFSKSNGESFISVEYSDSAGKVDVTGEPALHKHLDIPTLKSSMALLLDGMNDLKHEKLRLIALSCDEVDILETLDCFRFMQRVMELMSHSKADMDLIREMDGGMRAERLKLLGPRAGIVVKTLGLDKMGHGTQPQKAQ